MTDTDRVPITPELGHKVADYKRARESRARWEAEEKRLKEEILDDLGYDPDDPKPTPMSIIDPVLDVELFSVRVGTWRGMNFGYLKETYPEIYAECESSKRTVSIKLP